jgi:hypothetical protein
MWSSLMEIDASREHGLAGVMAHALTRGEDVVFNVEPSQTVYQGGAVRVVRTRTGVIVYAGTQCYELPAKALRITCAGDGRFYLEREIDAIQIEPAADYMVGGPRGYPPPAHLTHAHARAGRR